MTKLREIITITALSSLMAIGLSSKAEATSIFRGNLPDVACGANSHTRCSLDPPPGRFFEGRITLRYNEDANNPGFVCDDNTSRGFFSNGDSFQLLNSSCPEKVDEPQNAFGLIALGAFGVRLAFKRRKKQQKSSSKQKS